MLDSYEKIKHSSVAEFYDLMNEQKDLIVITNQQRIADILMATLLIAMPNGDNYKCHSDELSIVDHEGNSLTFVSGSSVNDFVDLAARLTETYKFEDVAHFCKLYAEDFIIITNNIAVVYILDTATLKYKSHYLARYAAENHRVEFLA